jgi:LuxR family maltose regulon positive regulatory protein
MVNRPRLIERLNARLHRKLTLISAPAGFGKTTLVSEWVQGIERPVAWLSLDEGENDSTRFLTYLVAALQTIAPELGKGVWGALQSPQPPPPDSILTILLNELTTLPDQIVLVLDDYHLIEAMAVDQALTFLVEHLPPQMHLVIVTREDPHLPLARLHARDHVTELRAAAFLNQMMGLALSAEDIAALEKRTEGWIAGLQLAALSLQGQEDVTSLIASFTGSHHFVLDYLMEEVLGQQSERIQTFLLHTSILDRMSGSLCDAVMLDPATPGQATLEYLERANLFLIPLDNERRWYRYHHLFAELLRLRLHQGLSSSPVMAQSQVNELHLRASAWYEDQGLTMEAFHHAAAANDIERAERLIEGKNIPRHFPGAVTTILNWLGSLPKTVLDARPSLWVRYATLLLVSAEMTGAEEKLQAAESALQGTNLDERTRDLIGQIAAVRATLALTPYQPETVLAQSRRALEYLDPENLFSRAIAHWTLGAAYQLQGDRAAARGAYTKVIENSQASEDIFTTILATMCLGILQEADNHLHLAVQTYQRVLQLAGDQPLPLTAVCSTNNVALVKSLGADRVIDYTKEDWTRSGETYDLLFDAVGKTSFPDCLKVLKQEGVYLQPLAAPALSLHMLWVRMTSRKTLIGGTATPTTEKLIFLKELAEAGKIKPVIDRRYPLEQIVEAHRYVDQGHKKGDVIITVQQGKHI